MSLTQLWQHVAVDVYNLKIKVIANMFLNLTLFDNCIWDGIKH